MKYILMKKRVTTVLILITIFSLSLANFVSSYSSITSSVMKNIKDNKSLKDLISTTESSINDNVLGKYKFVEGYGILQKLMNKNEENNFEVIKDNDGNLQYTYFSGGPKPVDDFAERVGRLKSYVGSDTKVTVLMPPDKFLKGLTNWEDGMPYSYVNETADNYIQGVNKLGIYSIDFRPMMLNSGLAPKDLYYKTDHHWKVETSFRAFQYLVEKLNADYNLNLDPNGYYTNLNNYNQINYEQCFIGSQGRKTGIAYGGLDDFKVIYPKFATSYEFYCSMDDQYEFTKMGSFEETLLDKDSLYKENTYSGDGDKYSTYLFGNKSLEIIKNKSNPKGPRIALIKDSYSVPLAAFLSTVCSEVQLIDPRYFKGDIAEYIKVRNFDYLFISIIPSSLTEEFFPYCKEDK